MLINDASALVIGFFLSLLIESPLIYARLKNKSRWVPVNAPPWMLGDDYHYFSILNNLHKRILNFREHKAIITPFARMTYFQMAGNLLNLLPYHIGYLVEDKRLGVLFVKIWNRILLFIGVCFFTNEIYKLFGEIPTVVELTTIFLFYFAFYPGPLSLAKRGIVWNLFNERHMFVFVHVNDLTRGMHSETTAPLLLMSVAGTLNVLPRGLEYVSIVIVLFSILLFFQYFAAFIVYAFFSMVVLSYSRSFILSVSLGISYVAFSLYYLYALKKCPVSAELVAHDDGDEIFKFSKFYLAELILIFFTACAIYVSYNNVFIILLFSLFSVFALTNFLFKHQFNRFWSRGAAIIVQLIATIFIVRKISEYGILINYLLFSCLLSACCIYFLKNCYYLYERSSTIVQKNIDDDKLLQVFNRTHVGSNYVTDSVELSYYINLYANDNSILRNYSIQDRGYQDHLHAVCFNYKTIGCSLNEFMELLSANPDDCQTLSSRENITDNYKYFHEAQYLATNYLFNNQIKVDGMYVNGAWTDKYKTLLINIWNSIKGDEYQDVVYIKAR